MLTKAQKREQSDQLRETLSDAQAVFLLENHGLKVNDINQLRSQIRQTEGAYKVVKNSVVKLAVEGTPMEEMTPFMVGPKALAFTAGDAVELGKVLKDFSKKHPELVWREAYLEGQILDPEAAQEIAEMPTKDELIAKLLYMLQSPIRRLVVALNGPIQNMTTVIAQIADQNEKQES